MKTIKVTSALALLAIILLAVLWILQVISKEEFESLVTKAVAVLVVLGGGVLGFGLLMGGSKASVAKSDSKPGPKF